MAFQRLSHVNLRVDRLDEAMRFYEQVIGLKPIPRHETKDRGAWYQAGEIELHLTEDSTPQAPSKRHIAIEVDDLAAAKRTIVAADRPIEREEENRFFTRDPAGNRIEVAARFSRMNRAVPVLPVKDVRNAVEHYVRVFGFARGFVNEGEEGPVYAIVRRDNIEIHLQRSAAGASNCCIFVTGVQAIYDEFTAKGATIRRKLETSPYGLRDFTVADLDGNVILIGQRIT
jgi:catechol 2,3-dioxygenase-like lactoylglutathione lyase family enzyme